jgi:hypothetical protein
MSSDRDSGFAILPGVFSAPEMEAVSSRVSAASLPRSRAGARNALSDPALSTFAHDARLLRIASDALGDEAFVMMRPLLVRASSKATGPATRRILHIEYATSKYLGDGLELHITASDRAAVEAGQLRPDRVDSSNA